MFSTFSERLFAAALFAAVLPTAATAQSQDSFRPNVMTCTTLNCGASQIVGQLNSYGSTINPWVTMVRGTPNRCLRLEVLTEQADLKMTAVRSDGTVYSNDDKGGSTCSNCPKIVIPGVASNQYYTVMISNWNASAGEALFTLSIGEYPNGNPNCTGATPPNLMNPTKAN